MQLTPAKVLLAEHVRVILVEARDIIRFVGEGHLALHLVAHCPQKDPMQVVIVMIPSDKCPVLELDLFVTEAINVACLEAKIDLILEPTSVCKIFIRSDSNEVTSGWVMARLLEK